MIILRRDNIEKIVDTEARAEALQKKGFIRVSSKDFSAMTKAQLIEYAEENGIEVDPKAKKAEILAAVE